jgi:hypothetical protein
MHAVHRKLHEATHFSCAAEQVFASPQPHASVQPACALMHGCPHSVATFFSQSALQPRGG